MDDYVTKPVRRDDLFRVLGKFTERSSVDQEPSDHDGESRDDSAGRRNRIDLSGLRQQVNGDESTLKSICASYVTEVTQTLARLPELIAANDWFEVRRSAHTVKAAMRTFGVEDAVAVGQKLEDLAGAESLDGAVELFDRFRRFVEPSVEELVRFIDAVAGNASGEDENTL